MSSPSFGLGVQAERLLGDKVIIIGFMRARYIRSCLHLRFQLPGLRMIRIEQVCVYAFFPKAGGVVWSISRLHLSSELEPLQTGSQFCQIPKFLMLRHKKCAVWNRPSLDPELVLVKVRGYELERQHVSPSDCISLRITGLLVAVWVVI